ncbi:MAG: putative lipid II flippase FtsW [bacterium]
MNTNKKQHSDYWLSLAIFALITFGLIMIYSVSKYYSLQQTDGVTDKYYLTKQLGSLLIGLVAWVIFQAIDYRFWQKHSVTMLFITVFFLLLPFMFHMGSNEAVGARWINIGPLSFQPAELSKLTLILYLSGWVASKGEDLRRVGKIFVPFLIVILSIAAMMMLQKDLGTLLVIIFISASILITAGISLSQLTVAGAGGAFLVWLLIKIEPYRMKRFTTFLNPDADVLGAGYHIRNALIAIGSGGLWGLGFGQSKQKYLYLPEAHTDSIFAIICEELGLLRAAVIILIFLFIAWRGYRIAAKAPDIFSRLVAVGITAWLFAQMMINIGAMFSLFPLTGVPLPFISYGGTSLIFLLSAVGILVNISKHTNDYKK